MQSGVRKTISFLRASVFICLCLGNVIKVYQVSSGDTADPIWTGQLEEYTGNFLNLQNVISD